MQGTRLLAREDVVALLTLEDCIGAVEAAFREHALRALPVGVLGVPVPGGGFHIKAAALNGKRQLFAAKLNANFAENEARFGMPTIQGLLILCDARHGYPLAVMDSAEITALRTAAATGVAAKHLAREGPAVVTIVGCGRQSRTQLAAIAAVRPVTHVYAFDSDRERAERFARETGAEIAGTIAEAARKSSIVVTCTSATSAILGRSDVGPGTFVAAVGADNEHKQEIHPALLASSAVITDLTAQAAAIGDLHHAIEAQVMGRDEVRGELGAVIAGLCDGRRGDEEVVIFDSTGTALQDVAAAALVYERACASERGVVMNLL